jgi:hypothetical protein
MCCILQKLFLAIKKENNTKSNDDNQMSGSCPGGIHDSKLCSQFNNED